jgi:hypothetical protein
VDVAVVVQHEIADAGELLLGVVVAVGDRVPGQVATGHDECVAARVVQQEMVQGRGGQHDPEAGIAWRHRLGEGSWALAQEHDRPRRPLQQSGLDLRDLGEAACRSEVGDQHGERLGVASLAFTQHGDGRGGMGVDGQVKPTDALDGHDAAGSQSGGSLPEGLVASRDDASLAVDQAQLRAAVVAGVGLGVVAPICGVVVLGLTRGTHRERGHGGAGPVVGQ